MLRSGPIVGTALLRTPLMFRPTDRVDFGLQFRPDYTLTDFCALLHKAQGVADSRRCKEVTYNIQ